MSFIYIFNLGDFMREEKGIAVIKLGVHNDDCWNSGGNSSLACISGFSLQFHILGERIRF